jgi:hypothetical protein
MFQAWTFDKSVGFAHLMKNSAKKADRENII